MRPQTPETGPNYLKEISSLFRGLCAPLASSPRFLPWCSSPLASQALSERRSSNRHGYVIDPTLGVAAALAPVSADLAVRTGVPATAELLFQDKRCSWSRDFFSLAGTRDLSLGRHDAPSSAKTPRGRADPDPSVTASSPANDPARASAGKHLKVLVPKLAASDCDGRLASRST